MSELEGRVALVTGGANGIGEATSRLLAERGAAVVIADLEGDAATAAASSLPKALGVACDVTRRDQVEAAVGKAVEFGGRLDILVACAGIIRDNLVYKMSDEDWTAVIDTHLRGTFLAAQAAQRQMVEQRYGKMVFLSSTSALGNRGQLNYSAAKAGLQGMAKTLAIELGRYNVNVNAVAPGFVETRMTEATAKRQGYDWEEYKKVAAERTALQRTGKPIDIANVIAFLCSDDSSYMTGQVLYVAGGPRG